MSLQTLVALFIFNRPNLTARDEERAVMQEWTRLPFLEIEGTYAVGKGLARGRFVSA